MKVVKILNNNLVYARDGDGRFVIVIGRGVGFYGKVGQAVDGQRVERIVPVDDKVSADSLTAQLEGIPQDILDLAGEVIDYAARRLEGELNRNVYFTLADHIRFAIERHRRGLNFTNPLLWEVKTFYPKEYGVGAFAVERINARYRTQLNEDEAAFIALHVVCARSDATMPDVMGTTKLVSQIIAMVQEYFGMTLDEGSHKFQRFLTHLKFLAGRIVGDEQWDAGNEMDDAFIQMVKSSYTQEFHCALKVDLFIEKTFERRMSEMELIYLTVHLRNMRVGNVIPEEKENTRL